MKYGFYVRSMGVITGVVVGVSVESVVVGSSLVVALVVVLSLLNVGVSVLGVLSEETVNDDEDDDESYNSNDYEPEQGAAIGCFHS